MARSPKGLRMSESSCIDSPLRGRAMPRSYSGDLRERVIEAVEGGASRRETAERFEVSVSSAVKWLQRWHESKSAAPKAQRAMTFVQGSCTGRDKKASDTTQEIRRNQIATSDERPSRGPRRVQPSSVAYGDESVACRGRSVACRGHRTLYSYSFYSLPRPLLPIDDDTHSWS